MLVAPVAGNVGRALTELVGRVEPLGERAVDDRVERAVRPLEELERRPGVGAPAEEERRAGLRRRRLGRAVPEMRAPAVALELVLHGLEEQPLETGRDALQARAQVAADAAAAAGAPVLLLEMVIFADEPFELVARDHRRRPHRVKPRCAGLRRHRWAARSALRLSPNAPARRP